ncbi:MAG: extracellular solute-binding protein [Lachnospiraceae bacterium]|nr:extracellular solute-binding protein [Lachnospiraceae bacterium]
MKRGIGYIIAGLISVSSLMLLSCGAREQSKEIAGDYENYEELDIVMLGNEPNGGMNNIYDALDELTEKDLNCHVRFTFIPWGNERERLNIAVASGEYDIIPNGNFSDYKKLIEKSAFLDLSPYLSEVPGLTEHYVIGDTDYLESCKIDGKIYGIPQLNNVELLYDSEGFFYRKDLLEEWGLSEVTDIETMEAYLYRAKKDARYRDKPLITDNRIWQSLWIMLGNDRYVEVESMQETPFAVVDTKTGKVVNRLETEEFNLILSYIKKWKRDGILSSDMLSLSDNEGTRGIELMAADDKPCETNVPIWSISSSAIRVLSDTNDEWEFDFFPYIMERNVYYTSDLSNASVISVSSKCKKPILALKFLEKVHSDQRYYDLMMYGVEGENYNVVEEKISYKGIDSANRFSYSIMGDYRMDKIEEPYNYQFYKDAVLEHDNWANSVIGESEKNKFLDSDISYNGMYEEIRNLESIRLKYFQPIVCGYYDDVEEKIEELNELLYENGFGSYLEKLQNQI